MKNKKYNGWTNRNSWRVSLWIKNDEGLLEQAETFKSDDELKEWFYEITDEAFRNDIDGAFAMDFIRVDLSDVDWKEIKESLEH